MDLSCPGCHADYRIDPTALAAGEGRVRCFRCGTVFEAPPAGPEDDLFSDSADSVDVGRLIRQLHRDRPDPALAGMEASGRQLPRLELSAADLAPLDLDEMLKRRDRSWPRRLLSGLLLVVLLLATAAHVGWLERERLLADPTARRALEWACARLPCTLPPRRDPQAFAIVQRTLTPSDDAEGALHLRAHFVNRATFDQPLPRLQLSLLDNQQAVVARRTLAPNQYLPNGTDKATAAPDEVVTIDLSFADPGPRATGFELAFY